MHQVFKSLLISLVPLFFLTSFAPYKLAQKHLLEWKAIRPIQWTDFKAKPDTTVHYYAVTSSGIDMSGQAKTVGNQSYIKFHVTANFDFNKSWVKIEKASDELLRHEQYHFNISELHARILRKELSLLDKTDPKILKKVNKLFDQVHASSIKMQELYDEETNHSINELAQEEWEKKIDKQLQLLIDYAL